MKDCKSCIHGDTKAGTGPCKDCVYNGFVNYQRKEEEMPTPLHGFYVLCPRTHYTEHQHPDYEAAKTEAERLAREHPGDKFVILKPVAMCKKSDIIWELPLETDDEIPF